MTTFATVPLLRQVPSSVQLLWTSEINELNEVVKPRSIFNLHRDVLASIIFEWLESNDVASFDTSVCQRGRRRAILNILSSPHHSLRFFRNDVPSRENLRLRWAYTRCISVSHLRISPHACDEEVIKGLCHTSGKNIKRLSFLQTKISINTLDYMGLHCKGLEAIDIRPPSSHDGNFTDPLIAEVTKLWPYLKEIDLKNSDATDSSLIALANGISSASLTTLHLNACSSITDAGMNALTSAKGKLSHLRTITLESCCNLTDAAVISLALECPLLQRIDLSLCTRLTCPAIQQLARSCPNLNDISLYGCSSLRDPGVIDLVQLRGATLVKLSVGLCESLSNAAFTSIAQHCPVLQDLDVAYNSVFSSEALMVIAEKCPLLQSLSCYHCQGFTTEALTLLREKRGDIEIWN